MSRQTWAANARIWNVLAAAEMTRGHLARAWARCLMPPGRGCDRAAQKRPLQPACLPTGLWSGPDRSNASEKEVRSARHPSCSLPLGDMETFCVCARILLPYAVLCSQKGGTESTPRPPLKCRVAGRGQRDGEGREGRDAERRRNCCGEDPRVAPCIGNFQSSWANDVTLKPPSSHLEAGGVTVRLG